MWSSFIHRGRTERERPKAVQRFYEQRVSGDAGRCSAAKGFQALVVEPLINHSFSGSRGHAIREADAGALPAFYRDVAGRMLV